MQPTGKQAVAILAGLAGLFALRVGSDTATTLRGIDEAHCAVAAARVVADGGPLYGNSVTNYAPLTHTLTAIAFRLGGLYNMQAVRLVQLAWWVATAFVVYAAARTCLAPAASLAAASAFLLAALNPGYQEIRGEPLTALPLAAAVGFCVRGVAGRKVWSLVLAGAAVGVAVMAKQQAGLALPVLAAGPLLGWWWRRREEKLWLAACASGLVVAGFMAVIAAVSLYYAMRGAGHAYFFCVWTHNWSFVRHCPGGRFLPSLPFFWWRVVRDFATEPLLPMAVAGALVGLGWRGAERASAEPCPWRARIALMAGLLLAMWLASAPGDVMPMPRDKYIHYMGLLYAPMSLLIGVCVEVASRIRGQRRLLGLVAAALAFVYVAVPAARIDGSVAMWVALYTRMFGLWHILAAAGLMAVAGWLLGGRRAAWLAPLAWGAAYAAAPRLLGWEGAHVATAAGLVALGLLRHACERKSAALAALAGTVHAAAFCLDWSPQTGLALGAALWVLLQDAPPKAQRCILAALYLACVVPVGLLVAQVARAGDTTALSPWWTLVYWWDMLWSSVVSWRAGGTLVLCGLLLLGLGAGSWRAGLRRVAGHGLGLLCLGCAGAVVAGIVRRLEPEFLTQAGTCVVLAAALAVEKLLHRPEAPSDSRASLLLASGCLAAGLVALGFVLRPAMCVPPLAPYDRMATAVEPGSRAFVWGPMFALDLCVRSRLVPAAPQYSTWMIERVGLPPYGPGILGYPRVALLDSLDRCLSDDPPPYVVVMDDPSPTPADLPRFGPILRTRYRVTMTVEGGKVYRLIGK